MSIHRPVRPAKRKQLDLYARPLKNNRLPIKVKEEIIPEEKLIGENEVKKEKVSPPRNDVTEKEPIGKDDVEEQELQEASRDTKVQDVKMEEVSQPLTPRIIQSDAK